MWMDERVQVLQEYHFLQLLVLIEFKNSKEIQHSSQHSRKKKKKSFSFAVPTGNPSLHQS